jgi:hypothetical protein
VLVVLEVVDDVVELVLLDELLEVVVVGGDVLLELVVVELVVLDDELEELEDELLLDELEVVGGIVLISTCLPWRSCLSSLVPRYWSSWLLCSMSC